jgi:hypothetical protein
VLCAAAIEKLEPGGSNRLVELTSQLTHNAMDNKPSFETRIRALREAAATLRATANVIMTEVLHMEAAQSRFEARKGERRQTTRASR